MVPLAGQSASAAPPGGGGGGGGGPSCQMCRSYWGLNGGLGGDNAVQYWYCDRAVINGATECIAAAPVNIACKEQGSRCGIVNEPPFDVIL